MNSLICNKEIAITRKTKKYNEDKSESANSLNSLMTGQHTLEIISKVRKTKSAITYII